LRRPGLDDKYAPGEAGAVVVGPLSRIDFEPDTVVVYGNSAQAMMLVELERLRAETK
jgi:uncharacterized protein (DUF169 family)